MSCYDIKISVETEMTYQHLSTKKKIGNEISKRNISMDKIKSENLIRISKKKVLNIEFSCLRKKTKTV